MFSRRAGRLAQGERTQTNGVGVALPNDVGVAHGEIDRDAIDHLLRDIDEDAIATLDRVIEPQQNHRRAVEVE